jgi:hypothetical protein
MSVNWHYFRAMSRRPTTTIPKAATGNVKNLYEFTGYKEDTRQYLSTGRPWRAEELRLKSHDDLHKLWYVLLKEKNKLKSDWLVSSQLGQQFYGYSDILKVRLSMSRLLTVVNERKKLRNEYRRHLEDEYIAKKKAEEQTALEAENEKRKDAGLKPIITQKDVVEMIKQRSLRKKEKIDASFETLKTEAENKEVAISPLLSQDDLKLISTTKVKLT